jgi:hypothetical protein
MLALQGCTDNTDSIAVVVPVVPDSFSYAYDYEEFSPLSEGVHVLSQMKSTKDEEDAEFGHIVYVVLGVCTHNTIYGK